MDGLFIFDQNNDIIYKRISNKMHEKIMEMALTQELIASLEEIETQDENFHNNMIIQLFSPLINSQKIMFCQFDNTYTSIQCDNNLNFVFNEFLGYIFIKIGTQHLDALRRNIGICVSLAKYVCGPNIFMLKNNQSKANLFTSLINTWEKSYNTDQAILLEAIEPLIVNNDLKSIAQKTLEAATEKLRQDPHSQRCHGVLFVNGKCLGILSSKQVRKLSSCDILFLSILCKILNVKQNSKSINIQTYLFFLQNNSSSNFSGCVPHIVHCSILDKGVILILLIEYGNIQVASSLYDTFFAVQKTRNVQLQGDLENLKSSFDNLDQCMKQTLEALKKAKYNNNVEISIKRFSNKWDTLKKKYLDFFKNSEKDSIIKIESNMPTFLEELKDLFNLVCIECSTLEHGFERVSEISTLVEEKLLEITDFLSVKAQRNLSVESYLEEFPGLVHFIFMDRTIGAMIAPDLSDSSAILSKERIWTMVEFSRSYLSRGHTSVMWKDTTFNYSYFLWFEDQSGTAVKPKELQNNFAAPVAVKPQYEPGILGGDYYQRLCEISFPKSPLNKLKCFEIFCIHLGLVTGTCALEHCRRLVATINDVTGNLSLEFFS